MDELTDKIDLIVKMFYEEPPESDFSRIDCLFELQEGEAFFRYISYSYRQQLLNYQQAGYYKEADKYAKKYVWVLPDDIQEYFSNRIYPNLVVSKTTKYKCNDCDHCFVSKLKLLDVVCPVCSGIHIKKNV